MNKRIFLFATLFLSIYVNSYSQEKKFNFTLIDTSALTKAQLFTKALSWLATTFVSSKHVIEMEDKEDGKIIGKGIFIYDLKYALVNNLRNTIHFTITIDVKDGKYRCVLSDFFHEGNYPSATANGGDLENEKPACGTFNLPKSYWKKIKENATDQANALLASLKKNIADNSNDTF